MYNLRWYIYYTVHTCDIVSFCFCKAVSLCIIIYKLNYSSVSNKMFRPTQYQNLCGDTNGIYFSRTYCPILVKFFWMWIIDPFTESSWMEIVVWNHAVISSAFWIGIALALKLQSLKNSKYRNWNVEIKIQNENKYWINYNKNNSNYNKNNS